VALGVLSWFLLNNCSNQGRTEYMKRSLFVAWMAVLLCSVAATLFAQ
jgi:hypothetical protein